MELIAKSKLKHLSMLGILFKCYKIVTSSLKWLNLFSLIQKRVESVDQIDQKTFNFYVKRVYFF
jgi:hypothetical protein